MTNELREAIKATTCQSSLGRSVLIQRAFGTMLRCIGLLSDTIDICAIDEHIYKYKKGGADHLWLEYKCRGVVIYAKKILKE